MKKQDFIQEFMERQRNLTPDECADLAAFVAQELFGHSGPNPISDQMRHLNEDEKTAVGDRLAKVLQLKPVREFGVKRDVRYMLGEGYHTKTALGLYEVIADIMQDAGQLKEEIK